jgi:Cupin superfamily protein
MSKLKANWGSFNEEILLNLFVDDHPFIIRKFVENPESLATWQDVEECCNNPCSPGYIMHPQRGKVVSNGSEWNFQPNVKDRFDALHNGGGVCLLDYGEHSEETNELMGFFEDKFNVDAKSFLQIQLDGMPGYGLHCDSRKTMGIFILQIDGSTDWRVYNNRLSGLYDHEGQSHWDLILKNQLGEGIEFGYKKDGRLHDLFQKRLNLIIEDVLNPGDLIYIPHCMYHHAIPNKKRISLSIPCFIRDPQEKPAVDRRYYRLKM